MKILTRADLDSDEQPLCQCCGEPTDEIYVQCGECLAPVEAVYINHSGFLEIRCFECEKVIHRIAVKDPVVLR